MIPAEAVPYLNKQLSPSLFDVTALSAAGLAAGARIQVTLGFAAGAAPTAPPGITLTSVSGHSAQGYLTAASGPAFAAGLRAAIGADVEAGDRPGSSALFGGLTSLAPAGAAVSPFAAPAVVSPAYTMYILQLNALDLTGAPTDNAVINLMNSDSIFKQSGLVFTSGGISRIAVPAGHYAVTASYFDYDANGDPASEHTVALDDFSVKASTATTTVTIDERTAVNPVTFSVPRPAVQDYTQTIWLRTDATGTPDSFATTAFGPTVPVYINSQPKATTGTVQLFQDWGGLGTEPGTAYRYDLSFTFPKIPADEAFVAGPGQLATVNEKIYADPASNTGGPLLTGTYIPGPQTMISAGEAYAGALTDYLGSAAGGQWAQSYQDPANFGFGSDVRTFAGGQTYDVEWAHGPLAPDEGNHTGPTDTVCLACASGGAMSVGFTLAGDSEPDHNLVSGPVPDYTVSVNGTPVDGVGGPGSTGAELTGLSATAPSTVREVMDTDSTELPGNSQSLTTHTDLTFTYVPGVSADDTLPSDVSCDWTGQVVAPCQILPVLNLGYQLATDFQNTSPPGPQVLDLTVNHLSYDGLGSRAPITSATVSVSFDGGATWQPATVTGANSGYVATWQNPAGAAGTSPDLQVTATDAAGGSITQTVTAAYTIAGSAS